MMDFPLIFGRVMLFIMGFVFGVIACRMLHLLVTNAGQMFTKGQDAQFWKERAIACIDDNEKLRRQLIDAHRELAELKEKHEVQ